MKDPADTARRRVSLKLAALAYVGTRHGVDACEAFTADAFLALALASFLYVASLTDRPVEMSSRWRRDSPAAHRLAMSALAYEHARHGSDGTIEFVRAALAMLCQSAVAFVESCVDERFEIDGKELAG